MNKKTISFSADPVLVDQLMKFAETLGISRSTLLNGLIEKFLHAHEKAQVILDRSEYVQKTKDQASYFCPTPLGVCMTFNFDMDFAVARPLEEE